MNMKEHSTFYDITTELNFGDVTAIKDFASDCELIGATQTKKYILRCVEQDHHPHLSLIHKHLAMDLAGI